jgi:hypothetical protein
MDPASDVWMVVATCTLCKGRGRGGRNMEKVATSLATCTLCQGRGAQHEKVFATCEKMFATCKKCSQHGKRCSQHGKSFRYIGKGVRNIRNTLCNIMIRRLICFLIRIVWLGRCPMLAPRLDVRALAVAYRKTQNV